MADSQVDFTGMKYVTCRKWISYDIILCLYADLEKSVYFCSGSLKNLFLQSYKPFHTTW